MTTYLVDGNNYSHVRHGRVDPATDAEVIRTVADFALRRTLLRTETEIRLYLDSGAHPDLDRPLVIVRVARPGETADALLIADLDYCLSKKMDCVVITADTGLQAEARERQVSIRHPADFVAEMIETAQAYRQRTGRSTPPPDLTVPSERSSAGAPAETSIGQVLRGKHSPDSRRDTDHREIPARPSSLPDDILARTRSFVRPRPTEPPPLVHSDAAAIGLSQNGHHPGAAARYRLEWAGWSNAETSRFLADIDCPEHRSLLHSLVELLGEVPAEELVDLELLSAVVPAMQEHCARQPNFLVGGTAADRVLRALLQAPDSGFTVAEVATRTGLKEKEVRHKLLGALAGRVREM